MTLFDVVWRIAEQHCITKGAAPKIAIFRASGQLKRKYFQRHFRIVCPEK